MSDIQLPEIVAVCPSCGSEFQPHVTRCIDCGTQTRSSWAAPERPRVVRAVEEMPAFGFSLPRDVEATVVRIVDLGWAERLGRLLETRGVPCRIEVQDPVAAPFSYSVCVAEADFQRALEIDREHMRTEMPEAGFIELPPGDVCPACGARGAFEEEGCPSCGLGFEGDFDDEDEEGN